jgi:hypothetical protein
MQEADRVMMRLDICQTMNRLEWAIVDMAQEATRRYMKAEQADTEGAFIAFYEWLHDTQRTMVRGAKADLLKLMDRTYTAEDLAEKERIDSVIKRLGA